MCAGDAHSRGSCGRSSSRRIQLYFCGHDLRALWGVVAGLVATFLSAATNRLVMTPQFSMRSIIATSQASRLRRRVAADQLDRVPAKPHRRGTAPPDGGAADGEHAHQNVERHVADLPGLQARESGGKHTGMENRRDVSGRDAGAPIEPRALSRMFSAPLSGISRADHVSRMRS